MLSTTTTLVALVLALVVVVLLLGVVSIFLLHIIQLSLIINTHGRGDEDEEAIQLLL